MCMQRRLIVQVVGVIILIAAVRQDEQQLQVQVVMGAKCREVEPPAAPPLTQLFPRSSFDTAFLNFWAPDHQHLSPDHSSVSLSLDHLSGAGFKSTSSYVHGLFSAAIKLPTNNYTAGVVTSFYLSNADVYPHAYDEVSFEFLGRIPGEDYILQTTIYSNGNKNIKREQRILLWFDPTIECHDYSILWTSKHIVFYIDDTPVRGISNVQLNEEYPTRELYLYATIKDGSDWATDGGLSKVNYSYAPFIAEFSNFILNGCKTTSPTSTIALVHGIAHSFNCDCEFSLIPTDLSRYQRRSISWVQQNYMAYNYCDDKQRYPSTLPECLSPLKDEL